MKKFAKNIIGLLFGILILSGVTGVQNVSASADCTAALEPYWYRNVNDNRNFGADNTTETFSMWGKSYYHGYFKNYYSDDAAVAFYLDKNYSGVSFIPGGIDGKMRDQVTLSVYLDGELYQDFLLTDKMIPSTTPVVIPTEGKTQMLVKWNGDDFNHYGMVNVRGIGHKWKLQTQIAPGVDTEGKATYKCENCKETKTEILPAVTQCPNYLQPYQYEDVDHLYAIQDEKSFALTGRQFQSGFTLGTYQRDSYASYNLDRECSKVTFTVGPYGADNGGNSIDYVNKSTGTMRIYLDNSLYQTVELFVPMMNQEFEIPTEGITQLRLEFEKEQFADYGIGDIKGVGPAHTFQSEILLKPQVGKDGVRLDTCTKCMASKKVILPALDEKPLKKGDTFKSGRFTYKVTGVSGKSGTAQVTKATSTTAALTVPSTVTKNGVKLQIKTISAKAFYKNKTKKVTIGKNVSTIGTQAFAGCQNLKNITIQSTGIKKMGTGCFKGIHKKAVIKVPASRLNTYKKLFKSQGQAKTVVIRK